MMSCSIVLSIDYYPKKTIFSPLDNMHLFFDCPFYKSCWDKIGMQWNTRLSLYPQAGTRETTAKHPVLYGSSGHCLLGDMEAKK